MWYLAIIVLAALPARAQWNPDSVTNTPVCDTTGQQDYPQICSDGADGAIVVWEDERADYFSIYAQHLNANGYATWTRNGVKIAQSEADQRYPIVASDGNGGAYVVWQDDRNSNSKGIDLYGQHIQSNGSLAYSSAGIAVASANGNQDHAAICSDGNGNAFVAWEDSRNATASSQPDIYLNKMTFGGVSFGSGGMVVDASANRQVAPAICPDGTGGCYVAWEDEGHTPSAIFARRISSNGGMLWGQPPPSPGVLIYEAQASPSDPQPNASNVAVSLDSNQLLLSWEVANSTSPADGQDLFAQRMSCSTTSNTTKEYSPPISVTGAWLNDQITPQIFSDDSLWSNGSASLRGVLVPFLDQEPGSTDDYDVAMVRVLGDGSSTRPPSGDGFFFLEQQPHAQNGYKAVKITDADPARNGILAVWNDARYYGLGFGKDTTIFAQRIDRNGHNYFPAGGNTKLAEPLCSGPDSNGWITKQVALAPRTDGGIAVWTDFRKGNNDPNIYAQLIRMDGSRWIPSDTTTPVVTVLSKTPPDDTNQCNSQCTTVLATDPGTVADTGIIRGGIDSLNPSSMVNMKLQSSGFAPGDDSVTFSICVVDSFQNGSGTVSVVNSDLKAQRISVSYCTISDTNPPVINADTLSSPLEVVMQITDDKPWDRGLKAISIASSGNLHFSDSGAKVVAGEASITDTATIIDLLLPASFSIRAEDIAGNSSSEYNFTYAPTAGIAQNMESIVSLNIFPNPIAGDATLILSGAPSAEVTISNVLGRTVDQFNLAGSHEWQASTLAPGIYIVRALVGDIVLCKRIVKE